MFLGKEEVSQGEKGWGDHCAACFDPGVGAVYWLRELPVGSLSSMSEGWRGGSAWASSDSPVARELPPSQEYNMGGLQRQATRHRKIQILWSRCKCLGFPVAPENTKRVSSAAITLYQRPSGVLGPRQPVLV